ncbi:Type I restriction-modification system specificity subunit [Streptococcus pyogenes]|uniref:restriction endonuclease subunit S n=1 Tax=Streptococcus pyogenes TaxID=1314 RepID=UPI00109C9BC9|nr:restriction endonuclease subunit S [Streptococcus pyogenes]QCK48032.1 restriction endonuclease subunit S [Streptococcus pyogenes]VHE80101.1 Type I restriction-modification system specificity subunit [Streptococcus pyogenes]VHF59761.1 Type I restriction-modification system specificity subunit [Streptococcus pyogenes]VHF74227.1 Type I restriction-modification system specificity subunit [Streptococcus pyogenes]VHH15617.1 Type I restriction-modification system specificity subunit [Streptococcus
MTKSKQPQYRFDGFEGEWEEKELGDIVQITMGQSPSSQNYTTNPSDYILVQGNADIKNGYVFPRVWTTQITKQADKGDIILSVRAPVGDVGKTNYHVIIGRGVAAIKGNEFIFQILKYLKEIGYWKRISTGSTFDSISSSDIKYAKIQIPSLPEQEAIGELFQMVDQLIQLQDQKLATLKEQKQTFLRKMFPAQGQKVPEIRLQGFDGEWEEKKLGEISRMFSGGTPNVGIPEYYNGNIPFIRSAEINSDQTELSITDKGLSNSSAKLVEKNTLLYALYGATSGEVGLSRISGAINQAILAIIPEKKYSSLFIKNWLYKQKSSIIEKYLQGGQGNLSGSIVKGLELYLPSLPEQEAIGDFFQTLDQQMSQIEDKLTELKALKQTLLNRLFV